MDEVVPWSGSLSIPHSISATPLGMLTRQVDYTSGDRAFATLGCAESSIASKPLGNRVR
jgi:hypothetical protein